MPAFDVFAFARGHLLSAPTLEYIVCTVTQELLRWLLYAPISATPFVYLKGRKAIATGASSLGGAWLDERCGLTRGFRCDCLEISAPIDKSTDCAARRWPA